MLPGAHRVRAQLAGGRVAEYWYAWRGGPRILSAKAANPAALAREVARLTPAAMTAFEATTRPPAAASLLSTLIADYLRPAANGKVPHLAHLSARTLKDRRLRLDYVRDTLGELELEALKDPGARALLLEWRDGQGDHPHTADARLAALAIVLKWARDRETIPVNPLERAWPKIYRTNRAEVVWTDEDLDRLLDGASLPFRQAVLFAVYTGLRGSDLVEVTWAQVGKEAITFATGKSGRRKHVVIPITPPLKALLAEIGRKDVGVVLTSSTGEPWSFSGLQTAMQRRKAGLGIKGLRWHDLRGTAATRFIRAGLPPVDVALILGWERQRIEAMTSYVTAEAVAAGMLARLNGARRKRSL
jgi:integrase